MPYLLPVKVTTMEDSKFDIPGQEYDWIGPKDETKHVVFQGQSVTTERRWYFSRDLITLDPDYSEFSVRLYDPRCRSLSFVYRTLAILPKSHLRTIYNLIGAYLYGHDKKHSS